MENRPNFFQTPDVRPFTREEVAKKLIRALEIQHEIDCEAQGQLFDPKEYEISESDK
jgi:hypothetical protein